jgi:hypothetical protein
MATATQAAQERINAMAPPELVLRCSVTAIGGVSRAVKATSPSGPSQDCFGKPTKLLVEPEALMPPQLGTQRGACLAAVATVGLLRRRGRVGDTMVRRFRQLEREIGHPRFTISE